MKSKKKGLYSLLVLLFLCLGIGYAALTTNLSITGVSHVTSTSWDVHWENVQVTVGSVEADTPTISNQTTVSYNVVLTKPGDFFEFTVDAVNDGTIDAMIESVSSTLNGNPITTLPDALIYTVTYDDGVALETNHELLHDTYEKYRVRIEYSKDINSSQLPSTNQYLNLSFGVSYVQATGNAQSVSHTFVYTSTIVDNSNPDAIVQVGVPIPSEVTQYTNGADALAAIRAATNDDSIHFYLKHRIENGNVTESYIEYVITPEMASNNPGVIAGTYSLRSGGATLFETTYSNDSIYYDTNKAIMLHSFGNDYCDPELVNGDYREIQCSIPDLSPYAFVYGSVSVVGTQYNCAAETDGRSRCALNAWLGGD